jgi:WD40 repeat protein
MDNASMLEVAESAGLSQPIVAVLFTSTLGQLIIVSDAECRVIEAQSGSTITSFSLKAYGRCSCACLDVCGRRLMTGSETGVVCMWEYSLGRLLKIVNRTPPILQMDKALAVKERVEVSCICCVAEASLTVRPLVVGDWNHNVVMCSDSAEAVVEAPPALLQGHRHDVLCVVSCGNFIVSGDANGLALVWFILNGHRRHSIQVTKSEGRDGLSGTSINCGVWIGSARLCYLGTSEGEIVGLNPVLGQIKTRTPLIEAPSVSCVAQGSIWSSENGRQFQMVAGTTDGNLFFFSVPVIDHNALALLKMNKSSASSRLKQSVHSNADALLNTKGSKLQKLGENYVPILEMQTHVLAHQNTVSAVVIAEISGITVTGSIDGGLRLWSWSGKPLSVIGTSIPWPYWEISNQSNQELISQEMERLELEREKESEYERLAKLKEMQDVKDNAARLHKQWCVNLAKTSSGAGLLPLSESVDVFKFLDESSSPFKSADAKNAEGKPKSGALLVPSSMSYRPIDSIDHICASLLKQNRQRIEDAVRASEEESRLGRIFMQLETAMTQSEDPRDAGHSSSCHQHALINRAFSFFLQRNSRF